MRRHIAAALTLLVATVAVNAGPTNLITNGGFEDTDGATVGNFVPLAPGSTTVSPWVVGGNGTAAVDVVGTLWQQVEGNYSLDLNGNNIGWAQQTIDTVAGDWYTLTFKMSGNPNRAYCTIDKTMRVFATTLDGGGSQQDFTFAPDSTVQDMQWESRSWTFQAPTDGTILKFLSTSGTTGGAGPVIDDVCVGAAHAPVPGALLLAGLGTAMAGWVRGRRRS
jgi:choice-of-anchor C domain-containing protein